MSELVRYTGNRSRNSSSNCGSWSGGPGLNGSNVKSDAVAVIASVPKAVQVTSIELNHFSSFIVGYVDKMLGEQLAGMRPVGVRVRIVAFEHDVVDADPVPLLDARLIRNEAAVNVLPE